MSPRAPEPCPGSASGPRGGRAGRAGRAGDRRAGRTSRGIAVAGVLAALLAVPLAGCGAVDPVPTPPPTVGVAGEVGLRPTITIPEGFTVEETTTRTLVVGSGPPLVADQAILIDYVALNVVTGETVKDTYAGLPEIRTLAVSNLGEPLYELLVGARVGSRLQRVELGTAADPDPHVLVVDVRPTRATGEALPNDAALPSVTLAEDGTPAIAVPTTAPPTTVASSTLIKGSGPQVAVGQSVVLQILVVRWADGAVVDSTWGVAPRAASLADLGAGLSAGLVEQTVGSQVLVVVPPADGNGVDTLVYVVDILATGDVAVPPAGTEGQPGG